MRTEAQRSYERKYRESHRDQILARKRVHYRVNPHHDRWKHRRRKYGVTEEAFAEMLLRQSGVCAICAAPGPANVDHDHGSGATRGLLCRNCNLLLGYAKDLSERLRAAADYIDNGGATRHVIGDSAAAVAA